MFNLTIQDFQSIKDLSFDVDKFTIIEGMNDIGKSAIIRAIKGLFSNPPSSNLVRWGADELKVKLKTADSSVEWAKGKSASYKKIKDGQMQTFTSVGRDVPSEISTVSRIFSINGNFPQIRQQFDAPFLVGDKDSVKVLFDLFKLNRISRAIELVRTDSLSLQKEIEIRKKDLQKVSREIDFFESKTNQEYLNNLEGSLLAYQKLDSDWNWLCQCLIELKNIAVYNKRVETIPTIPVIDSKNCDLLNSLVQYRQDLNEINRILANIGDIPELPDISIGDCETLVLLKQLQIIKKWESINLPESYPSFDYVFDLCKLQKELNICKGELLICAENLQVKLQELDRVETKFKSLKDEMKVCPVCQKAL